MKAPILLTAAQTLFTLFMYALGIMVLGIALYPSVSLIHACWVNAMVLPAWQRLLSLCFTLALGYFLFGFMLILTVSIVRVVLRLNVKEGIHRLGSVAMLKWMMASALYIVVRFTFMEFILLTPFCPLFYKLMGARIGKNVQINSDRVGDISILEIGDNSVIGGNATVICHSFEKNGLNIKKVKIGKNVIVGLNSIIMPGVVIGDHAVIAAGAILPKDTKVEPHSVHYGADRRNS